MTASIDQQQQRADGGADRQPASASAVHGALVGRRLLPGRVGPSASAPRCFDALDQRGPKLVRVAGRDDHAAVLDGDERQLRLIRRRGEEAQAAEAAHARGPTLMPGQRGTLGRGVAGQPLAGIDALDGVIRHDDRAPEPLDPQRGVSQRVGEPPVGDRQTSSASPPRPGRPPATHSSSMLTPGSREPPRNDGGQRKEEQRRRQPTAAASPPSERRAGQVFAATR